MPAAARRVEVPAALAASHARHGGDAGRAWIAALPALVEEMLDRWELRPDGRGRHGVVALVIPVLRADGTPAAVKFQPVDEENSAEPVGLRHWRGDGIVRLLQDDPATGTLLLERLDGDRCLTEIPDDLTALRVLAELDARLTAVTAPAGLRRLADIAAAMLADVPVAERHLTDPADQTLLRTCAAAVAEVIGEPGDRLLHWDLHYENVLAAPPGSDREPWIAIDPKPLAGDPGFEVLPALDNRWPDIVATGDAPRAVLRRFDLMTEIMDLDRDRAAHWTLGRVLQNALWDIEDGETAIHPEQTLIARAVLRRLHPA
ncbi:streptomycin 6-kinase [Actinoalloteichus hoggarensis]|uniref:Aminoglycoside/hydroxyurea antibiotic resistance kinase n=1 Tax=Actinoalloteichus hoggarensis TaxID=1470176 RepID=A0A221W4K4_9PSEU|nr:aminoglycoside phosphotransferase family protein [Actinoalloteichus hoggarensis]ASO20519.1 Aminoglycoside/hydroxyurea antibiotic resistance kinase [Actinoalloteichus hoggarensis]MBB5923559.1 streptomycin 6-kinase [Actinoalloteichus hoggarensis]